MGRTGVIKLMETVNNAYHIFREIQGQDVGIDGQIELVKDGFATAKYIGIQIRSGNSYLYTNSENELIYYPKENEIEYWISSNIPVFLVIYYPNHNRLYWRYITSHLLQDAQSNGKIQFFEDMWVNNSFFNQILAIYYGERTRDYIGLFFGVNILDLMENQNLPPEAPFEYYHLCDYLNKRLLRNLRKVNENIVTWLDDRDGECLTTLVIFEKLPKNIDSLSDTIDDWWDILETRDYNSEQFSNETFII